jgi:hypothetical protein
MERMVGRIMAGKGGIIPWSRYPVPVVGKSGIAMITP